MKEFGGYFQMMENNGLEYHTPNLRLNSARHAFRYLLLAREYKKVFVPFYICNSIIDQIKRLGLDFEFYSINEDFTPKLSNEFTLKENECVFLVNYFGMLKDEYIKKIDFKFKNIIVDNTQDFFRKPLKNIDTIYSCRKFFPVVEGGYLYTTAINKEIISKEKNVTYDKLEYLFKKYELSSNDAYKEYSNVEEEIEKQEIKKMSKLTQNFLKGFDYEFHKLKRERNFLYLHSILQEVNKLSINLEELSGPMFYPLLIDKNIKSNLINEKIYTPTLWNEVLDRVEENSFENNLVKNLHLIPIDFRWSLKDLYKVKEKIIEYMKEG